MLKTTPLPGTELQQEGSAETAARPFHSLGAPVSRLTEELPTAAPRKAQRPVSPGGGHRVPPGGSAHGAHVQDAEARAAGGAGHAAGQPGVRALRVLAAGKPLAHAGEAPHGAAVALLALAHGCRLAGLHQLHAGPSLHAADACLQVLQAGQVVRGSPVGPPWGWGSCPTPEEAVHGGPAVGTHLPCPAPYLAAGDRVGRVDLHQGGKGLQEEVAQALVDDHVGRAADGRPELLTQLTILRGVQPVEVGAAGQGPLEMAVGPEPIGPVLPTGLSLGRAEGHGGWESCSCGRGPGPRQVQAQDGSRRGGQARHSLN